MKNQHKIFQYTALLLSFSCLFAFAGCQRQSPQPNSPTGENSDISSVVVSSFPSSQAPESEAAPSMEESPASSQETPSTEKPPVSSQVIPSPSSQATAPVSQPIASEPQQPETPTIPFTIGERVGYWNSGRWQPFKATIVVIRSMAELKALYEQENEFNAPENYGKYNDAFFEEQAIVFVGQQLPSGSFRTRVNYLTRLNNQLIVDYSTLTTPECTDDVAIWQKLLEVSKADLEGITEIVPQYHEIELTENEDYDESEWKQ